MPRGYARAVADVLGTRNSSGCWDYGGADEQQSGVDLVNFLASQSWSNGKVAMIGGSYDGTTANMVAARGADAPGLVAIVPEAAISRWYGYAYGDGVRYFLNSEVATDEGFDTPLAFDFGLARTPPTDPSDPLFGDKLASRANPCESAEHTMEGYSRAPDYDDFWLERDYLKDAGNFRAAVLLAHGWQDYNVKQDEGVRLFEALGDSVPFKRAYLFQGPHASPSGDTWDALLDAFFERTLMGVKNGVEYGPAVITEGRTVGEAGYESTGFREESSWPPAGTAERTLWLRRTFDQDVPGVTAAAARYRRDRASSQRSRTPSRPTTSSPGSTRAPRARSSRRAIRPTSRDTATTRSTSSPSRSAAATRLAGRAVLDAIVRHDQAGAHLTPILVDVAPDGSMQTVARGFLNLDYRDGLASARSRVRASGCARRSGSCRRTSRSSRSTGLA